MSCHSKDALEQMLFDVVDALDLSDKIDRAHGPLGTPPAELVRLVLRQKDKTIQMLQSGMVDAAAQKKVAKPTASDVLKDDSLAEKVANPNGLMEQYKSLDRRREGIAQYRAAVLARMEGGK